MEGDRVLGQGDPLGADPVDAGLGGQPRTLLHGRQPEDRRRADEPAPDPGLRIVALGHRELVALAEPAPDRVPDLALQLAADVDEGRRARDRR